MLVVLQLQTCYKSVKYCKCVIANEPHGGAGREPAEAGGRRRLEVRVLDEQLSA